KAYSQTAVLAMVPLCDACGSVGISLGGTLGTIGVYGANDPKLHRDRIQSDFGVVSAHRQKLVDMVEHHKRELVREAKFYAVNPPRPEVIPTVPVPRVA